MSAGTIVRLVATLVIWTLFTTIVGVVLTSPVSVFAGGNADDALGFASIMALAAVFSTFSVWFDWQSAIETRRNAKTYSKSKREATRRHDRRRIERLIDTLDEDEIYDLEALLLDRAPDQRSEPSDGEMR